MKKGRLEAFSDGVIAIIITIMVLELKVPHGSSLAELAPMLPKFTSYLISFVFVGIYWNNHHHLLQAVQKVNGPSLWANLHLLFWLSLVPFATAWMGENPWAEWPVALYGAVLLSCGVAYYILVRILVASHGPDSVIRHALANDTKGKVSVLIYAVGVAAAFHFVWISYVLYILVSLIWLMPDRRIEKNYHVD